MRQFLISSIFFVSLASLSAVSAQSEASAIKAKFLVEGGIEYGGDDLFDATTISGAEETIKAGQGSSIGAGGQLEFRDLPYLMFRSTLSYKFVTASAGESKIRFTRIPLHVSAFYKVTDNFRLGVGAATRFSPKLKGDGALRDGSYSSPIVPRFELGFKWIAVTYTPFKYTADVDGQYSANCIGVFLSFGFPQ